MEPNNQNYLKSTMIYGAILGFTIAIVSLIMYLTKIMPVGFVKIFIVFIITIAFYYIGIHISTKKIRNNQLNGFMTYGQGLLIGVLVSFFACIISSFYTYIQNAIIDPDYIGRVMNAQKEWMTTFMQSSGVSESQIEDAISKIDEKAASVNHITTFFTSILSGTVFGLILSLISSAILKKNKDIFAEADVIDQEVN